MQSKVHNHGGLGGSPEAQSGPGELMMPDTGSGYKLTSRNFTIETNLFTLDLSWKKVEVQPSVSPPMTGAAPGGPAPTRPVRGAAPPDFHEVLRRISLARLLETPLAAGEPDSQSQEDKPGPMPGKSSGLAGRAYERAAPAGPLTGGGCRRFIV